jgi:hypothetical protein
MDACSCYSIRKTKGGNSIGVHCMYVCMYRYAE